MKVFVRIEIDGSFLKSFYDETKKEKSYDGFDDKVTISLTKNELIKAIFKNHNSRIIDFLLAYLKEGKDA